MAPIWESSSGNRQNTLSSAEDEQKVCDGVTRKLAAAAQRQRRSRGQEEQTEAASSGADAPFPPLGGSCGPH